MKKKITTVSLLSRLLLVFALLINNASVALAGPIINFDYSYDTNGFFTPERRIVLQAAADSLTSHISNTTWEGVNTNLSGGHYELALINPTTLNVSWMSNVIIPSNQITIYVGATDFNASPVTLMHGDNGDGASQLLDVRNVTGNVSSILDNPLQYRPVNSSITFSLGGVQGFGSGGGTVTRQWYFGLTDNRNPSDPNYNNYTDFYSTSIHEIGHVLGIYDPSLAQSIFGLDYDPNFNLAYTSQVQPDGSGGYVFTGSNAAQHYFGHIGQHIPLGFGNSHWADGVRSDSADGWTSITHENGGRPFQLGFSALDFGALQDIGYTVSSPVPEPETYAMLLAGLGLLGFVVRCRKQKAT